MADIELPNGGLWELALIVLHPVATVAAWIGMEEAGIPLDALVAGWVVTRIRSWLIEWGHRLVDVALLTAKWIAGLYAWTSDGWLPFTGTLQERLTKLFFEGIDVLRWTLGLNAEQLRERYETPSAPHGVRITPDGFTARFQEPIAPIASVVAAGMCGYAYTTGVRIVIDGRVWIDTHHLLPVSTSFALCAGMTAAWVYWLRWSSPVDVTRSGTTITFAGEVLAHDAPIVRRNGLRLRAAGRTLCDRPPTLSWLQAEIHAARADMYARSGADPSRAP